MKPLGRPRRVFLAAGMSDFVSKPINIDDLAAVVAHWIASGHKEGASGSDTAPDARQSV